jgi:hypothetical protein
MTIQSALAAWPYPRWIAHRGAGTLAPENTLADGAPIENTRLQVDCFDTTYAAAVALAETVKAAIKSSAITHVLLLEQDQFEPEALLHRVILDFSIWH